MRLMRKYLTEYRQFILHCLEKQNCDFQKLLDYHKDKIQFFQHERFIHLIVTMLFAIVTVMVFIAVAVWEKIILIPLAVLSLALLIPYIRHYYFLENQTQKLYEDYDKICEKVNGISQKGDMK